MFKLATGPQQKKRQSTFADFMEARKVTVPDIKTPTKYCGQTEDSFANSSDEDTVEFNMDDLVDNFKEECQKWFVDVGAEIFRSEIRMYLKSKKLEATFNLNEYRKPEKSSQKRKLSSSTTLESSLKKSKSSNDVIDLTKEKDEKST